MKDFPLPVRVVGSGSQPVEDEELQYLEMPRGMNTFQMPIVPEEADTAALAQARDLLALLLEQFANWEPAAGGRGPRIDLAGVPPPALENKNQVLGEGEVRSRSAVIAVPRPGGGRRHLARLALTATECSPPRAQGGSCRNRAPMARAAGRARRRWKFRGR